MQCHIVEQEPELQTEIGNFFLMALQNWKLEIIYINLKNSGLNMFYEHKEKTRTADRLILPTHIFLAHNLFIM